MAKRSRECLRVASPGLGALRLPAAGAAGAHKAPCEASEEAAHIFHRPPKNRNMFLELALEIVSRYPHTFNKSRQYRTPPLPPLGERGRHIENRSDIEMTLYFTDTGIKYDFEFSPARSTPEAADLLPHGADRRRQRLRSRRVPGARAGERAKIAGIQREVY